MEGETIQWPKEKVQNDRQWSSKNYTFWLSCVPFDFLADKVLGNWEWFWIAMNIFLILFQYDNQHCLWKNLVNSNWAIWSKTSSRIFFWMVKKPQSVGRHVAPLNHVIVSQLVFAVTPYLCVLSGKASNISFIVSCWSQPVLELMICCCRGKHTNHYTTNAIDQLQAPSSLWIYFTGNRNNQIMV